MRVARVARLAAVILAASSALVAAGACDQRTDDAPAVIVLGFDGLDYTLTSELMAAGRLPNFSRLAHMGGFSPLATSFPPQSPVAWSSFITGLPPDAHGIFDFVHRDPATLEPYLSTTRTDPPGWIVPLGPWQLPLRGGEVVSLRTGRPFWAAFDEEGVSTTIVRMPANYPPSGLATRELSGMGSPDILGTYGTFSFYTSDPAGLAAGPVAGGTIFHVRVLDDVMSAAIEGPENPFRSVPEKLLAPFTVYRDPEAPAARIVVGAEDRVVRVGEWTDWVEVRFRASPVHSIGGIVRFYLKRVRPAIELYVTPVNLDPEAPDLPISTPDGFAAELADATGRFYTQGMPEDTKAYLAGVLSTDELLAQAAYTAAENRRQYEYLLGSLTSGLLFHYFGHVDQVSHVLWRATDPSHPAYDAARDAPYRDTIAELYAGLDAIVGETLDRLPPHGMLVVMSDHGFASWRRSFHLNTWLERHGYLTVRDPARRDAPLFSNVDWSRTRAYGLGLNGLYINVKGRERDGIVEPANRAALVREIASALSATIDPATGQPVVTAVHVTGSDAPLEHPERAPDLVIGYAKGTRASSASALGEVPAEIFADNLDDWSGDHCMDPASVPGVLLSSRPFSSSVASIEQLPAAIINELHAAARLRTLRF